MSIEARRCGSGLVRVLAALAAVGLLQLAAAQEAQSDDGSVDGAERAHRVADEEVTVTAQRYGQDLQSVPVAVTALSAGVLEDRQVINLKSLGAQVPGILIESVTGLQNAPRIQLRGVGQNSATFNNDPAVGVYLDNVYIPRLYGAIFDFANIERVEVLRGPQGTLYGRNTSGGAINIVSRRPVFETEGKIELGYGSYNAFDVSGYLSGGLVEDRLAASLAFVHRRRDGISWAPNLGEHVNDRDLTAARLKLLYTPTSNLEFTLSLDGVRDDSGPYYPSAIAAANPAQLPNASLDRDILVTDATTPNSSRTDSWGVSFTGKYTLDAWTLTSITSYRDLSNAAIIPLTTVPFSNSLAGIFYEGDSFTQELSAIYEGAAFTLVTGLYYFEEHSDHRSPVGSNPKEHAKQDTRNYAAYGQVTWHLTDKVGLIGGLRYTSETKDIWSYYYEPTVAVPVRYPLSGSQTWSGVTPKVGIEYQVTPDLFAYATYTRGFKSGGWNRVAPSVSNGTLIYDLFDFGPEDVDAYEVGAKYRSPDKRLTLNLAGYINDVSGLQVIQQIPGTTIGRIVNASGARIKGLEIEAAFQITDELNIYGNAAFIDAGYTESFLCTNPSFVYTECRGKSLNSVSPFKGLIGFVYEPQLASGGLSIGANVSHTGKYYNDAFNNEVPATDAYTLVNAFITYRDESGHWQVTVEGKNLTDERYFGTALPIGQTVVVYPNDPRTFSVRVKYAL